MVRPQPPWLRWVEWLLLSPHHCSGNIFAVQGGQGPAAGVCALLTALLGFSQAVGLGKDREIGVKFLDNRLKAAVHGETAGLFSPSRSLCALKANNKHISLRFYAKIQWRNAIMRELAAH